MIDTTKTLRPGALYTYQTDKTMPILITEVVTVDDDNGVRCSETLSNDATETSAYIDVDVFGEEGTYIHVGDVRDHQNNPDVGDVFLWRLIMDPTLDTDDGRDPESLCVAEVVAFVPDTRVRRVKVRMTWFHNGVSWNEEHGVNILSEQATYVGHTRPVFDTPERYGR